MPFDAYLAQLISPLLSNPEKAKITASNDAMGVLMTLTVAREDMGSIIGKEGETAKCLRTLLRIAGIKQNARVSLKITEPDGSLFRPKPKAVESDQALVA